MKKLIIAAAIVCAAVFAQAANVKWTSDVIYAPNSDGSFNTALKLYAATAPYDLTTTITFYTADGTKIDSITSGLIADGVNKASKATSTTAGYDFVYGTDYKYSIDYALTYDGKSYTMSVDPIAFNQSKSTGDFPLTPAQASKWTAVPEPTSGLLLLLGVAGLALRRRRA